MSVQVVVGRGNIEGIDAIREKLGDSGNIRSNVTPVLRRASRLGAETARVEAPKGETGRLSEEIANDAITFRVRDDLVRARFGVQPVPNPGRGDRIYPLYVHEGTGLYGRRKRLITPRRAPMMAFPGGGKPWPVHAGRTGIVRRRSVRGQKPQPYMDRAFDVASAYVERHLDEMMNRIVE